MIAARLNDIISGIEEEKTTLCYSLGEGLKGRRDSVSARRYIAHMKSEGGFRDADLWEAMAKETGREANYIRYLEGVRRMAIVSAWERQPVDMPPPGMPTLPSPTGEVVLYLHDPRRRNRQAAHGSRFKVKFVRPPKGK